MPCDIGKKKNFTSVKEVSERLEDLVACANRDETFTVSSKVKGADVLPMKYDVI